MKSVVSVYTGFYSQTVKVSIVVPRKEQRRGSGMRIGGARWCFSSARCRVARISRSRDVYDFMGQLPWYTAS